MGRSQKESENLAKTQVLNLEMVEEVANYEKKTSKKPAVIVALIGLFLIGSGVALPIAMTAFQGNKNVQERKAVEEKDSLLQDKILSCSYIQLNDSYGTKVAYTLTLNFTENQLKEYVKKMTVTSVEGKEKVAEPVIANLFNVYKGYESVQINGYSIFTSSISKGMQSQLSIDLEQLEKSKLTDLYQKDNFANVEFDLNMTYDSVRTALQQSGYTCQ